MSWVSMASPRCRCCWSGAGMRTGTMDGESDRAIIIVLFRCNDVVASRDERPSYRHSGMTGGADMHKQIIFAAMLAASAIATPSVAQQSADGITVGTADIGGVVASSAGPEAGVWVIAETTDLPTKFARMVVTDDRGRYV